jgi:hypothetical protein
MHTLAQVLQEFYHLSHWSAALYCDNKKALDVSRHHRQRIKPSTKCADIHRILRSTKLGFQGEFTYCHVYSHMNQYLPWERLSLIQQMNCVCHTLAKRALTMALSTGYHEQPTHFLPREDAALVVWGEKITGDISQKIRFHACKEEVRKHLQTRKVNRWSAESFEEVDWEHLDLSLAQKPDMYKIWCSKQSSGFCGTRVQVGRYSGQAYLDERCPNCGRQETVAHLILCSDNCRTRQLTKNTDDLSRWLEKDDKTDPELAYWIPKYILMRGDKPSSELGAMSSKMLSLARSQDKIGWRNFTEGGRLYVPLLKLYVCPY